MSLLTISFLIWYFIGVISFLAVAKKISGEVDRMDILICLFSSFIGPLIPIIVLILDSTQNDKSWWDKKVF